MRQLARLRQIVGCSLICVLWAAAGLAQAQDAYPLSDAFTTIDNFGNTMAATIGGALGTAQVTQVVNVLFTVLALSFFVWKFVGFALRGFDVMDILEVMLTILFVYILLTSYQAIFPAIFSAGRYVGDAIGNGILGGTPGRPVAKAMMDVFSRMSFQPVCGNPLECLGTGLPVILAVILATIAVITLGIIAILVEIWSIWGFAIAFAIGWVTIPFLMYERLSFLFEGWLKFFFGVTVYSIVAKANLALVFLGIEMMLGGFPAVGGSAPTVAVRGIFDLLGLLVFVTVGIFSLTATGSFASSIVMGAGGGGVGGVVQSAARAGAKAASGGAGAIAGAMKR
jgi:TrbL/VirB6 plasmid conjugal transfer protein